MSAPNDYTPVSPIAPYFQFTDFTPAVPELYWNVYSAEERIKKLCMEMHKLVEYANKLGISINTDHDIINELEVSWTKLLTDGYVPQFADPLEWDISTDYAPLVVVTYHGDSYTSRKPVPAGTSLDDSEYWVETGNYNAQVEDYRQRVISVEASIDNIYNVIIPDIEDDINTIENIIPTNQFSAVNTVKEYIDSIKSNTDNEIITIKNLIPTNQFSAVNTVKDYIDSVKAIIPSDSFSSVNTVKHYVDDTKIPYPTGTNLKYGTLNQVLTTLADGTTKWQDPVTPSDAQAESVITTWLNNHPEATTTVQDGSISTQKLADGAVTINKLASDTGIYIPEEEQLTLAMENGYYNTNGTVIYDGKLGCSSDFIFLDVNSTVKILDTDYKFLIQWYNPATSTYTNNGTFYTTDRSLSFLSSYAVDGKVKVGFIIEDVDNTSYNFSGHHLNDFISCTKINYLNGSYIEDNSISADKMEDGVLPNLDGTVTKIASSYTKKYIRNFAAGIPVKIKLAENPSLTPIVNFFGLVNASDESGTWQFQLEEGQYYIWTPQVDYAALQWATNGSCVVEIYNWDGELSDVQRIFYCGENRPLTTLKAGLEAAEQYMNSILYVDAGEYDLIDEFGAAYFAAIQANDTMKGLQLRNRVHVIFSSNSKVVCNYTGDNANARKVFSPFNGFDYGFIIENLTLECSNVRYCVHDEHTGSIEECVSVYNNCNMKIDNSANSDWKPASCIGGGLGSNHQVEVNGCLFNAIPYSGSAENGIYYHQSNNTSNPNHCCRLTFKDNYIINGRIFLDFIRTDASEDSVVLATNNNLKEYADQDATGLSPATRTGTHTQYYSWNNTLRSS